MTQNAPENPPQNVAPSNVPEIDYDKLSTSVAEKLKGLTQSAPAPQNPPSNDAGGNNSLQTSIDALPEKIVNGIREAFQTPKPEATPPANEPPKEEHPEPGKPRSFADWWIGK